MCMCTSSNVLLVVRKLCFTLRGFADVHVYDFKMFCWWSIMLEQGLRGFAYAHVYDEFKCSNVLLVVRKVCFTLRGFADVHVYDEFKAGSHFGNNKCPTSRFYLFFILFSTKLLLLRNPTNNYKKLYRLTQTHQHRVNST